MTEDDLKAIEARLEQCAEHTQNGNIAIPAVAWFVLNKVPHLIAHIRAQDAEIERLRAAFSDASYALRKIASDPTHPHFGEPNDWENFTCWAENWLIVHKAMTKDPDHD